MLSKTHRLAKTKDVQLVFARGRGFFNPLFTVKFFKNLDLKRRFTVVVSTKVSKKAVVRNRIKRVLREFIRLNISKFAPGDYAVVVKPATSKLEASLLPGSLKNLLISAKLYQK